MASKSQTMLKTHKKIGGEIHSQQERAWIRWHRPPCIAMAVFYNDHLLVVARMGSRAKKVGLIIGSTNSIIYTHCSPWYLSMKTIGKS